VQGRDPRDTGRTLRLSQFLELHSRWLGGADANELAHRIRTTVGLLLDTEDVEVTTISDRGESTSSALPLDRSASQLTTRQSTLERKALATMSPQLQTAGDHANGAFPFAAGSRLRGCLHVTVPRPLFEGTEVVFLRFVAWLAGLVIASAPAGNGKDPKTPASNTADPVAPETDARRYVAMAVHDLRNPLNVISGYGSLLADETLGQMAPEQADAVDAINRQVAVLLGLIEQLIDFDRLASAETSLAPSVVRLRELFDELRERCFASTSAPVSWPDAEAAFDFVTDRRRLFAVVQNLVDNALKHGGAAPVGVTCTRREGRLVVTVTDRGPGLPVAVKQALTDRDATDRLRGRGSGLGLFTVACYVKALGGKLDVKAPEEGGTVFEVTLPPLAVQAAPQPPD
jgi:two-component sensor histidine kinase